MGLLLSGCGKSDFMKLVGIRRFKVGDCLILSSHKPEKWEEANPSYIISEIGDRKYHANYISGNTVTVGFTDIEYGHLWEDFYQKVNCPKDLK